MDLTTIQTQLRSLNTTDLDYLDLYLYNCQRTSDQKKLDQNPIKDTTCCNLCSASTEEYYSWKLVYGLKPQAEEKPPKEEESPTKEEEESPVEEEELEKQIYLDLCQKCANRKALSDFIQADLSWSSWASSWVFKPAEPEMMNYRHLYLFEEKRSPKIQRD